MRSNPNSNVAPGENSACRTAAATNAIAAAKASTGSWTSDPSEFRNRSASGLV